MHNALPLCLCQARDSQQVARLYSQSSLSHRCAVLTMTATDQLMSHSAILVPPLPEQKISAQHNSQ
jgi:hypothetical protein